MDRPFLFFDFVSFRSFLDTQRPFILLLAINIPHPFCHATMSSPSESPDIEIIVPEFINEGELASIPIPRDDPTIVSPDIRTTKGINTTGGRRGDGFDVSPRIRAMMIAEFEGGEITSASMPFTCPSPINGAYICVGKTYHSDMPPSHLLFTFTSSSGIKTCKKCAFPEHKGYKWYFLPFGVSDVVLCEITGKGEDTEDFQIDSLVFVRKETLEESSTRLARDKLWLETPKISPKFEKKGGREDPPIARDHSKVLMPSFPGVDAKDTAYAKESRYHDQSSRSCYMLVGMVEVHLSHLSVPFPSPSPLKGAYICVSSFDSAPSFLFTFTHSDGKVSAKKYDFVQSEEGGEEWFFLPIDLTDVVSCQLQGKGQWGEKNSQCAKLYSLIFLKE
ncbi:hypothetical protein ADUPG1_006845 [Aduncisulcus paluster]|uniref:Uncharacterized protein n=1 Tax=Aduncisulcus paluster TaxID=2918883 RepID=A0ABQ5KJS5_9EUKA|nr:hypothetical protein ADUPG1_006845 [Aduncisulcus paluster]